MSQPVITDTGLKAYRGGLLFVTGTGFGRVVTAHVVPWNVADQTPLQVQFQPDTGYRCELSIPHTVPIGQYRVLLTTLDNEYSVWSCSNDSIDVVDSPYTVFPIPPDQPPLDPILPTGPSVEDVAAVRARARLEYGDIGVSFQASAAGDGAKARFSIPDRVIDGATLMITLLDRTTGAPQRVLAVTTDYTLDQTTGTITTTEPVAETSAVVATGMSYNFFTDDQLDAFIGTAFDKVLRPTSTVEVPIIQPNGFIRYVPVSPYAAMTPAVSQAVSLQAAIDAVWSITADAAYDIDVMTAEGTNLPRSQRFAQLMQLLTGMQERYRTLANQLGVGLEKIEVFTFRRVSGTTNRYVPIYRPREYDDISWPERVYPHIPTYAQPGEPVIAVPPYDGYGSYATSPGPP